ncbi:hypothetical protein KZ387_10865 [Glaesserella parasuis]|nr:hypothetical protein [Glaesserella parasuis]
MDKNAKLTREEENLKRFTDTIEVNFIGAEISQNKSSNFIVNFKYTIKNKSKRNIRSVHWKTNYSYQDEIVLVQDTPVSFKENLKRGTTSEVIFSISLDTLPQNMQDSFRNNIALNAIYEARGIVFSNGSKIIVQ